MVISPRIKFLIINGLKGLLWMSALLGAYFIFNELVISKKPDEWIRQFYAQPGIVYSIYFFSEFFFGLFPPEIFMIWAFNKAGLPHYIFNVAFFAVVSYAMGYITFIIGGYLYKRVAFRYFRRKFLNNVWPLVKKYGIFLIIVAALTPVPWSATSLLVGAAGYPSKNYLYYALFRILRFAVYGFIIYQTHQI